MPDPEHPPQPIDPPPFLGTWRNVYTAVLIYLAVLLMLLYAVTATFHY